MTRGMEKRLRQILTILSLAFAASALFVAQRALTKSDVSATVAAAPSHPVVTPKPPETQDPLIEKLRTSKMTRAIVVKRPAPVAVAAAKPAAPELSSLIRVRAILDFGDPKDNEVVVEVIRTGSSRSYRAGDLIGDVNASIVSIDKFVTFKYEGKTLQLDVRSGEKAENSQTAPINGGTVAGQK